MSRAFVAVIKASSGGPDWRSGSPDFRPVPWEKLDVLASCRGKYLLQASVNRGNYEELRMIYDDDVQERVFLRCDYLCLEYRITTHFMLRTLSFITS